MSVGNVAAGTTAVSPSTTADHPRIEQVNSRLDHQASRILDGFEQGQLSADQVKQLYGEDQKIRQEERTMAKLDGGHLTKADQQSLNQQLDAVSKEIHAERHSGAGKAAGGTTPVSPSTTDPDWNADHPRRAQVNSRLDHQASRILDGLEQGQLSAGQVKQLYGEDQKIRQEERSMASLDGGHITKADQKALNEQLDVVSKEIYAQRHGGGTA
jgi:exonuclease I